MFLVRESRPSRIAATVVCAMACFALTVTSPGSAPPDWPPFLRARAEYPARRQSAYVVTGSAVVPNSSSQAN